MRRMFGQTLLRSFLIGMFLVGIIPTGGSAGQEEEPFDYTGEWSGSFQTSCGADLYFDVEITVFITFPCRTEMTLTVEKVGGLIFSNWQLSGEVNVTLGQPIVEFTVHRPVLKVLDYTVEVNQTQFEFEVMGSLLDKYSHTYLRTEGDGIIRLQDARAPPFPVAECSVSVTYEYIVYETSWVDSTPTIIEVIKTATTTSKGVWKRVNDGEEDISIIYGIHRTHFGFVREGERKLSLFSLQNQPYELTGELYRMGKYILTIGSATGGTTDPPPGSYEYDAGSEVEVTARPDEICEGIHYALKNWTLDGTVVDPDNPITILMDSNHTLTPIYGCAQTTVHGFVEEPRELYRLEKVKVTLVWGDDEFTDYTDEQGEYKFDLTPEEGSSTWAYLEVELTDEDGIIEIYDLQASSTEVARYQTDDFYLKSDGEWLEDVEQNITVMEAPDIPTTYDVREDHLDDLAFIYWSTYTAVKFYRDKLGVTFGTGGLCDHNPVKVLTYGTRSPPDDGVYFRPSDWTIYIKAAKGASDADSLEAPQNREWHEFSHYVQWDVYGGLTPMHENDTNHGGFQNHCTSDSWAEGFAEFMAMAIDCWVFDRMTDFYPVGDTVVPLDLNYLDNVGDPRFKGLEEIPVASILWDLYDGGTIREDDDQVDLTIEQLWSVMSQQRTFPLYYTDNGDWIGGTGTGTRYISCVKDLYDAMIASSLAESGAIDNIFISHGFYWDVNGNGMYDAGENVGVGDYNRIERRNFRLDDRMSVLVEVPADVVPATLVVNVKFSPPYESYDYSYEVPITSASQSVLIWMPPTDYESTAYFTIQKEGYEESEAFTLSNDYYWSNVGLENHVSTYTFSLEPTEPTPSTDHAMYAVAIIVVVTAAVIAFAIKRRRRIS